MPIRTGIKSFLHGPEVNSTLSQSMTFIPKICCVTVDSARCVFSDELLEYVTTNIYFVNPLDVTRTV